MTTLKLNKVKKGIIGTPERDDFINNYIREHLLRKASEWGEINKYILDVDFILKGASSYIDHNFTHYEIPESEKAFKEYPLLINLPKSLTDYKNMIFVLIIGDKKYIVDTQGSTYFRYIVRIK